MLFCLKEHNSVVFISCADTVKFRLSVQVTLAHLTPEPPQRPTCCPVGTPNTYFHSTRDHSKEHPPIHDHLLVGFHTQPPWLGSAHGAGTLAHEGLALVESPALLPPGPCAG